MLGRAAAIGSLLCAPDAPAAELEKNEALWGVELVEPALEQWEGQLPPPKRDPPGKPVGVGDPVVHSWKFPAAGTYQVSCFSAAEPALRFHLTLEDRSSGTILYTGAARSTSVVLDIEEPAEIIARVANLESNADDRYLLRVERLR